MLVKADMAVLSHLPAEWLERSQLAIDIMGVISAHVAVYGPRLAAMGRRAPDAPPPGAANTTLRPVTAPPMQ